MITWLTSVSHAPSVIHVLALEVYIKEYNNLVFRITVWNMKIIMLIVLLYFAQEGVGLTLMKRSWMGTLANIMGFKPFIEEDKNQKEPWRKYIKLDMGELPRW